MIYDKPCQASRNVMSGPRAITRQKESEKNSRERELKYHML